MNLYGAIFISLLAFATTLLFLSYTIWRVKRWQDNKLALVLSEVEQSVYNHEKSLRDLNKTRVDLLNEMVELKKKIEDELERLKNE